MILLFVKILYYILLNKTYFCGGIMCRSVYADQFLGVMGVSLCDRGGASKDIALSDFSKIISKVDNALRNNCNTIVNVCSYNINAVVDSYPTFFAIKNNNLNFISSNKDDYFNYFNAGIPTDILKVMQDIIQQNV